ncbi:zinc-binding alcohol dehydrogenase family protein [Undibacter mobilis]|uniref:Zinc-type alcohol dehydrogenase-like protein n=1 Tax=Undibacter mobilis TaxID=2292256 RepID=A0A371BCV8_9BRAD|nr:zinc-binding alcohol dehydrogenase family protein [Undibacter mobilis]RDV05439.1 zinc-binding alcohol dehydrogenase family protein [Undibacter mobilis]
MKAVGYLKSLPLTDPKALVDFTADKPSPGPHDLRVAVKAISVNPVDTKVRMRAEPKAGEPPKVLGYDAAGVVEAVGADVTLFKAGDEVFYAGSIARPGTNSEFHLVDERIVGKKPTSLTFAQAAALPLTSITAWEMLFDRLGVKPAKTPDGRAVLVIGGGGGVGSIMIQLARRLTGLTIIATASRQETRDWCLKLGADHVIDHHKPLAEQLKAIGHPQVAMVAGITGTDQSAPQLADIIAPQGQFVLIDDPKSLNVMPFKPKSISVHWESMFTRSVFGAADMITQHKLLNEVSAMVDAGLMITTAAQELSPINAANLIKAHQQVETGTTIGKIVLSGW